MTAKQLYRFFYTKTCKTHYKINQKRFAEFYRKQLQRIIKKQYFEIVAKDFFSFLCVIVKGVKIDFNLMYTPKICTSKKHAKQVPLKCNKIRVYL